MCKRVIYMCKRDHLKILSFWYQIVAHITKRIEYLVPKISAIQNTIHFLWDM